MKLIVSFALLSVLVTQASAQLNTTPALKVEETHLPVFTDFLRSGEKQVLHIPVEAPTRLYFEYQGAMAISVPVGDPVELPGGRLWTRIDVLNEPGWFKVISGNRVLYEKDLPVKVAGTSGEMHQSSKEDAQNTFRMDRDFTALVRFRTQKGGTLFSRCAPGPSKWVENAKALYLRGGRLTYDIGWVGAVSGPRVNDGKEHLAALVGSKGGVEIWLDGKSVARKSGFRGADVKGHVFKIGASAKDFGHDFEGAIGNVRFWKRALDKQELTALTSGKADTVNTPDFNWLPGGAEAAPEASGITLTLSPGARVREAFTQPLGTTDHAGLIAKLDGDALLRGEKIYHTLCVTCHGTAEKEGTLPTALKFHEGAFKNGSDPFRMFQTLEKGFGLMVPQPQYTAAQKYDVIHYIREKLVKPHNPTQYTEVIPAYRNALPWKSKSAVEKPPVQLGGKQYEKMDFGPALMWTYQVEKNNIAYKAIAVRLDAGPGGVSKGKGWMVYDHDTMRVAAAWSGDKFVDWRGIAFDGSHGSHTSIVGDKAFVNPVGPGFAEPGSGSWKDPRLLGRDDKPYGPLPRSWVQYKGLYYHGNQVVIDYTVGDARILESPGWIEYGAVPIYSRSLNIGKSSKDLIMRVAPEADALTVALAGASKAEIVKEDGFVLMKLAAANTPAKLKLLISATQDAATVTALGGTNARMQDLSALTRGGAPHWTHVVTTQGKQGETDGAFAVDTLVAPDASANPWESWMRLGGFDFYPDGKRAAVCTWMGDVWIVEGIDGEIGELTWKRICTGLFQPLGLKIVDGKIYVTCRDQLARLHDLNGDEEIDHVECFNNDHQVTEHFHEFAMGLQTDNAGNFYYAKSARHAKTALVPHHGTLLRVSKDGSKTDILATGFRAANGVCLNPDGTWIVTDQEGHWNPKNRINYVKEGGFYGNMYGYHEVTDSSDAAMEQPLCWITNAFDRSPAELLWVPDWAKWGALNGQLLNLSYGYGKIYTVPHEVLDGQAQGGMCELPIPQFATGVMRGRFHPKNGQLYGAGLFAWAGSQRQPGGLYRVRYTGGAAVLPVGLQAKTAGMNITFSDPLDPASAGDAGNYTVKIWDLKRTKSYGSKHYNTKELDVAAARVSSDKKSVFLELPDIAPTWCMEIACEIKGADGKTVKRVIHNTIHRLK